ncbi:MAG TPA: IS982 family transposase [Pyrinomonadaceae bacterium]
MDSLIIAVFCLVDDALRRAVPGRLRRRGPRPVLTDAEVLTVELVGEHLGLDRDAEVFAYFRRHYGHFFPALCRVHRTTFARQAANLWRIKEALWQRLLPETGCDPRWALADSFPLAVCRFGRAPRCRRFRGLADYGQDHAAKATIYGFRLHARVCWPGVVTRLSVAPAGAADLAVVEELTDGTAGVCLADRAYWAPELSAWLRGRGVELLAPFKKRASDPTPERSRRITRIRYRIETVFSQLCERLSVKRVWARDLWHLSSRLLRKVLAHTLMVALNRQQGHAPLRLAELLTN